MRVLETMEQYGYEELAIATDPSGLRAFIAIHDTTLGPACGGVRIWPFKTEDEAVTDALRLARAMTYKSAAAGLHLGGGKGLIMADPHTQKSESIMRAFGRFVDTLGGRYITTEDVGCQPIDLEYIAQETDHVVGLPVSMGGSGDSSIMTGYGIYLGMKATAKEVWGSDSLSGKTVAMQGFGKVGFYTSEHLLKDGVRLIVADTYPAAAERARKLGAEVVAPEEITGVECDIFAPCALGGTLNSQTISALKCRAVAGGANNQLASPQDGEALQRRGILYAPDFIINAGGIINASCEIGAPYSQERAKQVTERIYDTLERVFALSRKSEVTTARAAEMIAEERLAAVRKVKRSWR